jgi:hypothetical protein
MNAFNMILTHLISVGMKLDEEDHCMTIFCSLRDSRDNLVLAIGNTMKTLVLDEEVRYNVFESTNEALVVHGRSRRSKEKGEKRERRKERKW